MTTRIIFNGQEYDSPEAMAPDVRKAYQMMLDQLQDKDKDGIPDVLQGGSAGKNVLGMLQTSVSFNGRTLEGMDLPAPVRRLIGNVIAHEISKGPAPPELHGNDPSESPDTAPYTAGLLLAFVGGFVLIFSVGLMFAIGGGREYLKGRLILAIAALLLSAGSTRRPPSGEAAAAAPSPGYRRVQAVRSVEQPWFVARRRSAP
jgi:hypothetical protein